MKIAVLGATGPSGMQVVKEALERGHEVTAVVRNPDKMTEKHEKLKVRRCYDFNIRSKHCSRRFTFLCTSGSREVSIVCVVS